MKEWAQMQKDSKAKTSITETNPRTSVVSSGSYSSNPDFTSNSTMGVSRNAVPRILSWNSSLLHALFPLQGQAITKCEQVNFSSTDPRQISRWNKHPAWTEPCRIGWKRSIFFQRTELSSRKLCLHPLHMLLPPKLALRLLYHTKGQEQF